MRGDIVITVAGDATADHQPRAPYDWHTSPQRHQLRAAPPTRRRPTILIRLRCTLLRAQTEDFCVAFPADRRGPCLICRGAITARDLLHADRVAHIDGQHGRRDGLCFLCAVTLFGTAAG